MRELNKVLDQNEKVFWEGRPKFWPYFLTGLISTFLFGLVLIIFLLPFVAGDFIANGDALNVSWIWKLFLIPFFFFGLWLLAVSPIYKLFLYKHLYYTITDKRVIIQKGVIGRDFEYIDFDQITNAEVKVDFWDKVLKQNSGSIFISSAGSFTVSSRGQQVAIPYFISNVENPYNVFKFLKKVTHDVKTDIQYPNKLRPDENPGYQTNYDPNKK